MWVWMRGVLPPAVQGQLQGKETSGFLHAGTVALGQLGGLRFVNKLFHTSHLDGGSMARVLSTSSRTTGSRTHSAFDSAELEFTARPTRQAEPCCCGHGVGGASPGRPAQSTSA